MTAVLCWALRAPSALADDPDQLANREAVVGWEAFGGTTGVIAGVGLGTLGTIGLCSALQDGSVWCPISATAFVALGAGIGYALGRFGTGELAEQNAWSERAGWGAAMTPFGLVMGAELALGITQAVDPDMKASTRIGITAGSAVALGVLSYAIGASAPSTTDGFRGLFYGTLVGLVLTNIITFLADAFSYDEGEPARSPAGLIVPPAVALVLGTSLLLSVED